MIVFYNTFACERRARKKWKTIFPIIEQAGEAVQVIPIQNIPQLNGKLKDWLRCKSLKVIAAGGDGTVNLVLNFIMSQLNEDELKKVQFGAIGLGHRSRFDFYRLGHRC